MTLIDSGEAQHPGPTDPGTGATPPKSSESRNAKGWGLRSLRLRHWLWLLVLVSGAAVLAAAGTARPEEYTIELGPYSLPAHGGHGEIHGPAPLALALPVDGWLQGLAFEVVDESGA